MRPGRIIRACAVLWVCALSVVAAQGVPPAGAYRPPPPPEQPIAYSHKTHLALKLDLTCASCHATAQTDDRATLPPTSTCMRCHAAVKTDSAEIQKLAGYDTRQEPVPWRRVYRLPDYVYFSHRVHMSGARPSTCDTCHGNVREMVVMQKVNDISMAACVECHTVQSATTRCDDCHEPRG